VVAVANDLTFQSGAFSPAEDAVFRGAAELAISERLPLLYLAANSGAVAEGGMKPLGRLTCEWPCGE
jgi:acetyl-CoA carboxylase beta subunit